MRSGTGAKMAAVTTALWARKTNMLLPEVRLNLCLTFYSFPEVVAISSSRRKLVIFMLRFPNVNKVILGSTNDVFSRVVEHCFDLTAVVGTSFILARQGQITKVIDADSGVVGCNEYLHI